MTIPSVPDRSAAPAGDPWIVDVDGRNFEQVILERSATVPVVVDFWATWCGPCKTLGPELERRAREGKGRFLLAKVDIDRSPELAGAFRVQAVPTVLAVVQGRLVDGFQGALPPAEIDEFLGRIAPLPAASRADQRVERALEIARSGQPDQGIGLLREILREHPDHLGARLGLVELLLDARRPREARLALEKAAGAGAEERIKALQTRLEFAEKAGNLDELEDKVRQAPDDLAARIALGKSLIAAGEHARGLEQLLEVVRSATGETRDQAKKAMLETFEILGLQDKIANEYRFKLSLELFS
jgi:putative thioredoxin